MKHNERNAGAKKKFPNVETEILHIRRKVPKGKANNLKEQVNDLINQLQKEALQKCADDSLKSK